MASSAITNALVAVLEGDAPLAGLAPDGVYIGTAPPHAAQFVLVSYAHGLVTPQFRAPAFEEKWFDVSAVMRRREGVDLATCQAAAARIEAVLDGARLLAAGYTPMTCERESAIEWDPEVDDADDSVRWYRVGGVFRVAMSFAP
jgi:hypothetical protein